MTPIRPILIAAVLSATTVALAQSTSAPAADATADASATTSPVERATGDAVARLYAKFAAERVEGVAIGEILDRVGGQQRVLQGLSRADQIGGPRDLGGGLVQVNLEVNGGYAAQLILDAVRVNPTACPVSSNEISKILSNWSSRSFRATGDSGDAAPHIAVTHASLPMVAQTQTAPLVLPDIAPGWASDAHTASAVEPSAGSSLRTARVAERSARAALRDQLSKLAFEDGRTLGAAGASSQAALDLAAAAARIAGVDYRADGSVEVRVTLDGQQLWQTLRLTAHAE